MKLIYMTLKYGALNRFLNKTPITRVDSEFPRRLKMRFDEIWFDQISISTYAETQSPRGLEWNIPGVYRIPLDMILENDLWYNCWKWSLNIGYNIGYII